MERYKRQISLEEIGKKGQIKLSRAKVLVVGAGGLGCPAIQYLAAAGVGEIGIIDHDFVEESNLQRQVIYKTKDIGKSKAVKAKAFAEKLNPAVKVKAYTEKFSPKNAMKIVSGFDILLDASDNQETRYLTNDVAIKTNKSFVYAAVYKFLGQLSVFNYQKGPSYRCLFPKPSQEAKNCNDLGVLGVLPGVLGLMQAQEVLKIILGIGGVCSGKLLVYDALKSDISKYSFAKNDEIIKRTIQQKHLGIKVKKSSKKKDKTIDFDEFLEYLNHQIIDVRSADEKPKAKGKNLIQIPLDTLVENLDKIKSKKQKLMVCKTGIRSAKSIQILEERGIINCINLDGGIDNLNKSKK